MQQTDLVPARFRDGAARMAQALARTDKIIVAGHVAPDGDAVGSLAAAGHVLRAMGKEFFLYARPDVPQYLRFLPFPGVVRTTLEHPPFIPQAALLLDCGEASRLGEELAERLPSLESLNIDHHLGGSGMGNKANWVEPEAAATAQLMAYVTHMAGLPLAGDVATCLALGIITDTGGFCHGNTDSDVLALAAHLAANGCDISLLRHKLENDWSLGRMRLWGELMSRIRLEYGGSVAFCPVFLKDMQVFQALREDLEGFAEQMRRLRGVSVAVFLREDAPGLCKFSLRSYGATDVRAVAALLGGGGHRNAAGGTLHMGMEEAQTTLLAAVSDVLGGLCPPKNSTQKTDNACAEANLQGYSSARRSASTADSLKFSK